jgi:hypothetical protein
MHVYIYHQESYRLYDLGSIWRSAVASDMEMRGAVLRLYPGAIKALSRLYLGSIKALIRRY